VRTSARLARVPEPASFNPLEGRRQLVCANAQVLPAWRVYPGESLVPGRAVSGGTYLACVPGSPLRVSRCGSSAVRRPGIRMLSTGSIGTKPNGRLQEWRVVLRCGHPLELAAAFREGETSWQGF
jgi:hypothetical protein